MNQVLLMSGLISVLISSTVLAAKGSDKALDNNPPPSTGNKINACVHKTKGDMRTVATSNQCNKHEYYISWNIQGPTGDTGSAGVKGDTGIAGVKGDTGIAGVKGDTGIAGAIGKTGINGATGAAGAKGDTGIAGVTGAAGAIGKTGINGATGAAGAKGDTGIAGVKGDTGIDGAIGPEGPIGEASQGVINLFQNAVDNLNIKREVQFREIVSKFSALSVQRELDRETARLLDIQINDVHNQLTEHQFSSMPPEPYVLGDNSELGGFVIDVTPDGQHGIVLSYLDPTQFDTSERSGVKNFLETINQRPNTSYATCQQPEYINTTYCNQIGVTPHYDWQLPNAYELTRIVDQSCNNNHQATFDFGAPPFKCQPHPVYTTIEASIIWQFDYDCRHNMYQRDVHFTAKHLITNPPLVCKENATYFIIGTTTSQQCNVQLIPNGQGGLTRATLQGDELCTDVTTDKLHPFKPSSQFRPAIMRTF